MLDAQFKDHRLKGLTGEVVCVLALPNDLAVGRVTGHGHGWFRRVM